jgi:hypothetical protein
MRSEIIENIEQAFLQLEFSIKLLTYVELKKIEKTEFDTNVVIEGQKRNLNFFHSSFDTYDDLIHATVNNLNITLGFTSIVLEASLQALGIKNDPNDRSKNGMLRNLIYMIRCAYAHDMMYPKWEAKGPYAQPLEIHLDNEIVNIDLMKKHGEPFDMKDLGGYRNYFEIKDKILTLIKIS